MSDHSFHKMETPRKDSVADLIADFISRVKAQVKEHREDAFKDNPPQINVHTDHCPSEKSYLRFTHPERYFPVTYDYKLRRWKVGPNVKLEEGCTWIPLRPNADEGKTLTWKELPTFLRHHWDHFRSFQTAINVRMVEGKVRVLPPIYLSQSESNPLILEAQAFLNTRTPLDPKDIPHELERAREAFSFWEIYWLANCTHPGCHKSTTGPVDCYMHELAIELVSKFKMYIALLERFVSKE